MSYNQAADFILKYLHNREIVGLSENGLKKNRMRLNLLYSNESITKDSCHRPTEKTDAKV